MIELPRQLVSRLDAETAGLLTNMLDAVGEELARVYVESAEDHRPGRGDNAQIFGQRVWHRFWFRMDGRVDDLPAVRISNANHSHQLVLDSLRIGVHKVGDGAADNVHESFPDGSATQRGYGKRNYEQLLLFGCDSLPPTPDDHVFALDDLVVVHFGSRQNGLAKWYVGACAATPGGDFAWLWVERLALPERVWTPAAGAQSVTPFSELPEPIVEVRPRRPDQQRLADGAHPE